MAKKKEKKKVDQEALELLVSETNLYINAHHDKFMLSEACSLTVKKFGGQYTIKAHVGAEEFWISHCLSEANGRVVYIFNPDELSDYEEMVMSHDAACRSLIGFEEYINAACNGEHKQLVNKAKKEAVDIIEKEKLFDRTKQYANLGFGSW